MENPTKPATDIHLRDLIGANFSDDALHSHAAAGPFYTHPQLYQQELEKIFYREWNFACHSNEISQPGDYRVLEIGHESICVIRGRDGEIRAFYNVCQHRGHQILTGSGTIKGRIVCPYHAWSYNLQGELKGAPKMQEVPNFDCGSVQLGSVKVEIIAGFVFVNLDAEAQSLRSMAPEFADIMTNMVAEHDQLQHVTTRAYDIQANWKLVTENFLEAYHVEFSGPAHRQLGDIIDVDTYRFNINGRTIEYIAKGGEEEVLPYQTNATTTLTNGKGMPFHQVFLYPHMTFSVFPATNMLFVFNMRPNGVGQCAEEISYYSLDGDLSPPSQTAEAYVSQQLNVEDIELVEAVHKGVSSRGYQPAKLMIDAQQQASWSEHFIHHFNSLVINSLTN